MCHSAKETTSGKHIDFRSLVHDNNEILLLAIVYHKILTGEILMDLMPRWQSIKIFFQYFLIV